MDDAERVLVGLDPEQREAALAVRGPVCILAGAGTGKTRAITHRIAYGVRSGAVPAGQLLAVTFTARAAGELRARLRNLGAHGVQARTFHAAALRQLQYFAPRVLGGGLPEIVDNPLRLVGNAAARLRLRTDRAELRDLAAEIDWAKSVVSTPDAYPQRASAAGRQTTMTADTVAKLYAEYEEVKRRTGQLDFADLLLIMAGALEEIPDVAEEVRARYRHFVVDEYQDVSPLQQRLLDAWLGSRDDLCVVGDPNQTIYSFAGATPDHLIGFRRRFPQAVLVRLHRDYRSTPQIVALANTLTRDAGVTLAGQRSDGPDPSFSEHDDEPAEAAYVATQCRTLVDGGMPAAEIAVLFRVNAQSEVYEQALTEAGIPYQVRGGERFFARPEVRQAMSMLRTAVGRVDGAGDLVGNVRSVLGEAGLTEQPPAGGAARERWESLLALVELAEQLATDVQNADFVSYVKELELRAESQHPPTVEGVTLASLHAAKGLEWDAVFLVGLVDGTLPIAHAEGDDAAVEEERRLLYVGVTRAREHLRLSWALSRTPGGRRHRRRSRFLYQLVPDDHPAALPNKAKQRPTKPKRVTKPRCRLCDAELVNTMDVKLGRCSDCPSDVDEGLLEALRSWRSARAKQLKVPAYVVFTDSTLTAIAEQRPSDEAALVAISGIGATKVQRFGADVLELVRTSSS